MNGNRNQHPCITPVDILLGRENGRKIIALSNQPEITITFCVLPTAVVLHHAPTRPAYSAIRQAARMAQALQNRPEMTEM